MDLEKNKQRLEILAAEVEELKNGGGGGTSDSYTKEEADDKFAEKTNVYTKTEADNKFAEKATTYTKTEVDEAIASAGGDLDLSPVYMGVALSNNVEIPVDKRYALEKHLPITFDSVDSTTRETYVFAGSGNASNPASSYYYYVNSRGYQFKTIQINRAAYRVEFYGKRGFQFLRCIDNSEIRNAMFDPTMWDNVYRNGLDYHDGEATSISANTDFSSSSTGRLTGCGLYRASTAVAPTLLNCPTKEAFYLITDKYADDDTNKYSQTIVENSGARIFKRGTNSDNSWTDWHLVGCDYFNPTDETLTDGGTISATALADALKHLPLSFNAHVCYYSYEDTNNVYYVSTRLNGASLHTNVVAINKTTGVATFNEFDQS